MRLLLFTAIAVATLFHLGESADAKAVNRSNSRYAAPINYQPRESDALHRTGQVAECLRSILRNHRGLRMARSSDSPTSIVECLKLMVRGQSSNATQILPLKKEVRVEKTIRAEVNPKRKQKCIHRVLVADNSEAQKQTNNDIYGQKIQTTSKTGEGANKVESQAVRVPDEGVRVSARQPAEARSSSQPVQVEQHPEQHQSRDVPASAESHEDPDESGELVNAEEHQDSDEQPTLVKPVSGQQPKLDAADQVQSVPVAAVSSAKIGHERHEGVAASKLAASGQVHSSKIVADVKGASAESKEETNSAESGEEEHDPNLSQESVEHVEAEKNIGQEHHDEHELVAADQVHSVEDDGSHEAADESTGQSAEEVESKEEADHDETVAQQHPAPSSDRVGEEHPSAEDRSTEAEGSHEAADESTGSSAEEADSKESNDQVAQPQPVASSDPVSEEHSSAEDRSTESDKASGEERGESVEDSGRSKEAADQEETPHSAHDSERSGEEQKSAEEAHDESSREEHGESAEQPASHATRTSKDSVERVDQQSGEDRSQEATHDAANSEERSESGEETVPSREAADSQEHDAASSGSHSSEKVSQPAPQMSNEPASAEESNQESAEGAHDDPSEDEADSEERDRVIQGQAKLKEVVPLDGQSAEEHEASHEVEGRHSALSAAGKSIQIENLKEHLTESFGTSAETIEDERSAEEPEEQSHEFRTGLASDEDTEGHSVIGAPENDKSPAPKPVRRDGSGEHSAEVADPVAVKPATSSVKQMAHIQQPASLVSRLKIKPLLREVAPSVSNFCIVGKLYVAAQGAVAEQCKVCSAFFQCLGSQQAVNLCRRKDDTSSAESSELDQSSEQRAKKVKVRQSMIVDYVRTITDSSEWNEYLTEEVGVTHNQEANDWGRSGKNCYNRFGSVKGCMTPYLCLGYVYP